MRLSESISTSPIQVAIGFVIITVYAASFLLWSRAVASHGRETVSHLVPLRPREQPFWNPSHFLLVFGVYIFVVSLLAALAIGAPEMKSLSAQLLLNTLGGLIAVGGSVAVMEKSTPGAIRRLGLVPTWPDARLGLFATVMILPPTMLISGIVSNLVEYHHPVLDSLKAEPGIGLFVSMLIGTALVTPFVEEFLFRVLLQGGLQSLADRTTHSPSVELVSTPTHDTNPYSVTTSEFETTSSDEISRDDAKSFRPTSWWPIVVASLVFASLHLGQGAAPIPLFFLSLGLGFLYRQTGNITACFVVHAVLNFITLAVNFAGLVAE